MFAPYFGRTLKSLNEALSDRISDHAPIAVDLPFLDPLVGRRPLKETSRHDD